MRQFMLLKRQGIVRARPICSRFRRAGILRSVNLTLLSLFLGLQSKGIAETPAEKPNIVVILTDDWGWGDLGAYNSLSDVSTPNLDRLAKEGVLFTDGYVTAPQCAPSRAALLTGRYQQRFGLDRIGLGPLPPDEITLADRLGAAGYVTGMVGKWQLEPNSNDLTWARNNRPDLISGGKISSLPPEAISPYLPGKRGFQYFHCGEFHRYFTNFDKAGADSSPDGQWKQDAEFRVDVQTDAALAFIEQQHKKPFFLYLSYFAPHVPLEAPKKYLERFSSSLPERRQYGLALMSAVDDGVGRILEALDRAGLRDQTLIIFTSDNGAPLGAQQDKPMDNILPVNKPGPAWDGSRNDPFRGEKGMLSEGGIRVPFILSWPGVVAGGKVYRHPVSTLDIAATGIAAAGLPQVPTFDGVDLIPYISDIKSEKPHEELFWGFWNQVAIRSGDWKFIETGDNTKLLFDLSNDKEETRNVIAKNPQKAEELRRKLYLWKDQIRPGGFPLNRVNDQERKWYQYYFGASQN